jgi:hypothetical protein
LDQEGKVEKEITIDDAAAGRELLIMRAVLKDRSLKDYINHNEMNGQKP